MHKPTALPIRLFQVSLTLLLMLAPVALPAQGTFADPVRTWPVDSILARFEADARARPPSSIGSALAAGVLSLPSPYASRRDSLLNGLERMALLSDDQRVRHWAASELAFSGTVGRPEPPLPGVLRRLVRIYRARPDPVVRIAIRRSLPEQAERSAALTLLRGIAATPDTLRHVVDHVGDERLEALDRLAEMGEEGRAVLQTMHRNREARSPQGQARLEEMARRGFPVRDLARERQRRR